MVDRIVDSDEIDLLELGISSDSSVSGSDLDLDRIVGSDESRFGGFGSSTDSTVPGGLPKIDRLVAGAINLEFFWAIPFFRIALEVTCCLL
jgi:hypothetical protein